MRNFYFTLIQLYGRAIAEKALSQGLANCIMIALAKTLLKRRKEYYMQLAKANKSIEITDWLLWFSSIVIEAKNLTLSYIYFVIAKTKIMDSIKVQVNLRQEKALLHIFKEGLDGFDGGLSTEHYMRITSAASALATRDLVELVKKNILKRVGECKTTRYFLVYE